MAPTNTVTALQADDLEQVVDLVVASKHNLAFSMLLVKNFPDTEGRKRSTGPAVRAAFNDPDHTNLKVCDDQTGELLGHLVFKRNRPQQSQPKSEAIQEQEATESKLNPDLAAFNLDVLNSLLDGMKEINDYMAGKDHLEIVYIVVKNDHRRQGIGRVLMMTAIEKSKEEGIPIAAHCEPRAYEFFKSLGFKDTVNADFDLAQFAPPRSGFGVFRFQGIIRE